MSAYIPLSRAAPRAVRIRWRQEDGATPIDCTGCTCALFENQLPVAPSFPAASLTQGEFDMVFTPAQAAQLQPARLYPLRIVLLNALNVPIMDFATVLKAQ